MNLKILIASDSFKDSITSKQVGEYLKEGFSNFSNIVADVFPISDGGEGSLDSLISESNGKKVFLSARDPLFRIINTYYGVLGSTAIIEMAKISGLQLLKPEERNPMKTSTVGTGELIKDALNKGYRKFLITIGGSATCDGGMGMASALGYKFFDEDGNELLPIGENLLKIFSIDSSNVDGRIFDSTFKVACDVDNPLYGENGASYVYSEQKGANFDEIAYLDRGLRHLSKMIIKHLHKDVSQIKGSGAAGGLGAGLITFLNAELKSGIDTILNTIDFEEKLKNYDIVVTGEGTIDSQTLNGKAVSGIVKVAKKLNKKVIVLAPVIDDSAFELYNAGVSLILPIQQRPITVDESIKDIKSLLIKAAITIGHILNF